ncbi:hypothetical protein ACWFNE_20175 [Cellulomonas sp. NPDC055163]
MGEQAMLSWNSGAPRWQRLANEVDVPPAREQTTAPAPVPCMARLMWEVDGPEIVETEAIGWTSAAVLVRVYDRRWRLGGVWVPVSDVRRRGTG